MLVDLFDHVLEGLQSGRLAGPFTCDGQAIVIEDYLKIRPEKRALVEEMVRDGRMIVGPWYDLSDEFLVSGESLIRNLERGHRVARELGGTPSKAGWVCDLFGHASQLPQILKGFGIDAAFLWRGIADGTELLCYRFGARGYATFALHVRVGVVAGFNVTHVGAREESLIADELERYVQSEAHRVLDGPILLFDGGDHEGWDENAYNVIRQRIQNPNDEFEFVHSTLDQYLAELRAVPEEKFRLVEGELREAGRIASPAEEDWVIPGVLSSRVWIKQENARCQALLCQWAEPFSALANQLLGREWPTSYLDVAWQWLMKNHPHDSICGCSIDAIHEDMKYRFRQCFQIAERLTLNATTQITAAVGGDISDDELRLGIFNSSTRKLDGSVEITIPVPAAWPGFNEFFGFEGKPGFRIYDAADREIPFQRLAQRMNQTGIYFEPLQMPMGYPTNHVTISLPLQIPALGYTTLTARRMKDGFEQARYPAKPALAVADNVLENEFLRVEVRGEGIVLTDKQSGAVYDRVLTFEDSADIGDGWYHGVPVADRVVTTSSTRSVELLHNGPFLSTFAVRSTLEVPRAFDFTHSRRSAERVEIAIETRLSLRPGQKWLEVEIDLDNKARDHRLRVLLPSGASGAQTYFADSAFDVVERSIALRADNHLCRELEIETKPQTSWTAVRDEKRGLAVVCSGDLLEGAVRDLPQRPIALTLLRATQRTVMTEGEPKGQILGSQNFRFAVQPLAGSEGETGEKFALPRTELGLLAQYLAGGTRAVVLNSHALRMTRTEAKRRNRELKILPREGSLLTLNGDALLTSARFNSNDGEGNGEATELEIRLWNPHEESIEIAATALNASGDWRRVELDGRARTEENVTQIAPKQVATLRLSQSNSDKSSTRNADENIGGNDA